MQDNGEEREGGNVTDEGEAASESQTHDDAVLHEKNGHSSFRENI